MEIKLREFFIYLIAICLTIVASILLFTFSLKQLNTVVDEKTSFVILVTIFSVFGLFFQQLISNRTFRRTLENVVSILEATSIFEQSRNSLEEAREKNLGYIIKNESDIKAFSERKQIEERIKSSKEEELSQEVRRLNDIIRNISAQNNKAEEEYIETGDDGDYKFY